MDYPIDDRDTPIRPLMYNAVAGPLIHWRTHFPQRYPSDFRVFSYGGVGMDWPISYEDLAPCYERKRHHDGCVWPSG